MGPIISCLWFDNQAQEAAAFYVSVFRDSKMGEIAYYSQESSNTAKKPVGSVLTVGFELNGQQFIALNGGPEFKFTEAVSLMVPCEDQAELDYYWEKLCEGGEPSYCGWLKDKYGLSWQVAPAMIQQWLHDPDREKANRVMDQIMAMRKLDFKPLIDAYNG